MNLSNQAFMGLGIYMGYKSTARRREMSRYHIDYDQVVNELTEAGLIVKGKLNTNVAERVFHEKVAQHLDYEISCSQVLQYDYLFGYGSDQYRPVQHQYL